MPIPSEGSATEVTTSTSEASQTTGTQATEAAPANQQQTAASSDAKPAESSTATQQDAKQTPLDVVRKVMAEGRQATEQAVKQQTEKSSESGKEGDQGKTGQSTEEPPKVSDKNRENWKALEADRDKYRDQVAQFGDKAQRYDTLSGYLTESGITGDDFSNMLKIGRAMKTDPKAAFELLAPVMQALEMQLGLRLPQDLQQRVSDGLDSEETARNLSIARARQAASDHARQEADRRAAEQAEATRIADEQRQHEVLVSHVTGAVTTYEQQWAASDPDYQRKYPLVKDKVMAMIAMQGLPASPEAALKQIADARKEVEIFLTSLTQSNKQPIKPVTGGTGGITQPRPDNPLSVVRNALNSG